MVFPPARLAGVNAEARTAESLEAFARASGPGRSLLRLAKTPEGVPYLAICDAQSALPTFSLGDHMRAYLQVGEYNLVTVVKFLERSEIFSHLGNYAEGKRLCLEQARNKINEKIRKYNSSGWRSKLHEFVLPLPQALKAHAEEAAPYDRKTSESYDRITQEVMALGQDSQLAERLERLHETCTQAAFVTEPIVRQWKEEFDLIMSRSKSVIKNPPEKFNALETSVRDFILGFEASLAQKALLLLREAARHEGPRQAHVGYDLFECFRTWLLLHDGGTSKYVAQFGLVPPANHDEYTIAELAEATAHGLEEAVRDDDYLHGLILNDMWDINCKKNRAWQEGLRTIINGAISQINILGEAVEERFSAEVAHIRKQVEESARALSKKAFDDAFDLVDLEVRSLLLEARVGASAAVLGQDMAKAATCHGRRKNATIKRLATQKEKISRIATKLSSQFFASQITQQNLEKEEKFLEKLCRRHVPLENDRLIVQLRGMQERLQQTREACNMLNEETLGARLPTQSWKEAFRHYVSMIRKEDSLSSAVGLNMLGRLFRCRIRVYKQEANGVRMTVPVFDQIIRPPQNPLGTIHLQYEDYDHFSLA